MTACCRECFIAVGALVLRCGASWLFGYFADEMMAKLMMASMGEGLEDPLQALDTAKAALDFHLAAAECETFLQPLHL